MNCVAIDDEPLALEVIKKFISQTEGLALQAIFTDAIQAQGFLQKNETSLLLCDIRMPGINGLDLYRSITPRPMVIFTTAHPDYAAQAFELDAVDYLLKPFNLARFQKAIAKSLAQLKLTEVIQSAVSEPFLYINSEYKTLKIPFNEIIYIEALDDYVKINTLTQSHKSLLSMKKMVQMLPEKNFIRIHRSYIVAREKLVFIQARKVGLINNVEVPVGDTYKNVVKALLKHI